MPRVYETMRRAEIQATAEPFLLRFVVRLWIDTENEAYADQVLAQAVHLASVRSSTKSAAEAIAAGVEHVNAVEVLDRHGNGTAWTVPNSALRGVSEC